MKNIRKLELREKIIYEHKICPITSFEDIKHLIDMIYLKCER